MVDLANRSRCRDLEGEEEAEAALGVARKAKNGKEGIEGRGARALRGRLSSANRAVWCAYVKAGTKRPCYERELGPWLSRCQCERGDSNPHGFPHWILSPARLPIPPLPQKEDGAIVGIAPSSDRLA